MDFNLISARAVLERTPSILEAWLLDLGEEWGSANEGPDTWSAVDVVGHLIHGEKTDWLPRVEHLLRHGESVAFPPFDRFAQLRDSEGKTLNELIATFGRLRKQSLDRLSELRLSAVDLERTGTHPTLGRVRLAEHLATWVAHDLDHIAQIARVMAKQFQDAVGPWRQFLRVMAPDRL